MTYKNPLQIKVLLLFLFATLLTQVSCEKFSGSQTVPAYIHIDSITLTTDYATQGSASHSITDAWVYVDDDLVGAFQLPATFPVLKEGKHKVTIKAGIKKNGIATTRDAYPFYTPIQKTINFVPGTTVSLGVLSTTYQANTSFLFMEDFDNIALKLDTTSRCTVPIGFSTYTSGLTFEGFHSGLIQMDSTDDFFECQTNELIDIPSSEVFLEMNFNTNNYLTVSTWIYTSTTLYEVPIITLFPTNNKWKKIYIDLTTTLNAYSNSTKFRLVLGHQKDSDVEHSRIILDNVKIVTRKSS
ncbi:MAG: hypothetical protein Q8867_05895 [Bacteroidota bacterium]|nr:hypothetical protein [Bacteroidota bacterium]